MWIGGGAREAGAEVARLAERLAAPVLTTYGAAGVLAPSHPCLVGMPPHVAPAGALWDEADVVVAIGTDLDGVQTQNFASRSRRRCSRSTSTPRTRGRTTAPRSCSKGTRAS